MNHKKDINWLNRNKQYLSINAIADKVGMNGRALRGALSEDNNNNGTPFKVPEKHHEALSNLINEIRKR